MMWIHVFLVFVVNSNYSLSQKTQWKSISCEGLSSSTAAVELNTSFLHAFNFSRSEFCVINNTNLKITSNGEGISVIQCGITNSTVPHDSNLMTGGIAFINSTVEIERVSFVGCGTYLDFLPQHIIGLIHKSSTLKYSNDLASALAFINCKMRLVNVTMNSSFGFAVIGLNSIDALFINCSFSSYLGIEVGALTNKSIGSGVIIHFTQQDDGTSINGLNQVTFHKCRFMKNWMNIFSSNATNLTQDKFISYAAGLTILHEQRPQQAIVTINETVFSMNFGPSSLLIKYHGEGSLHSKTIITNCMFLKYFTAFPDKADDYLGEMGASEVFLIVKQIGNSNLDYSSLLYTPLLIKESLFDLNVGEAIITTRHYNIRALRFDIDDVAAKLTVKLEQVACLNNTAIVKGVCVYMRGGSQTRSGTVTLVMDDVKIAYNRVYFLSPLPLSSGIITLKSVSCIIKGGNAESEFKDNYGVAIDAMDSIVKLSGRVLFKENTAINGPAITVKGDSQIHFMEHSEIMFVQNKALKLGGAIYAVVGSKNGHCAINFNNVGHNWKNKVLFTNNSAIDGGESIYASPIFNCNMSPSHTVPNITTYNNAFKFIKDTNNGLLDISTLPKTLQLQTAVGTMPREQQKEIWVYPGQYSNVCLIAKDPIGRNVYATVKADFIPNKQVVQSKAVLHFKLKKTLPTIRERNSTCTNLTITIYSTERSPSSHFYNKILLFYLEENQNAYKKLFVFIKQCPLGFELNNITGYCECSRAVKRYSKDTSRPQNCNITDQTFIRHHNYLSIDWAGTIDSSNGTKLFGISPDCSFGLCKAELYDSVYNYFSSTASTVSVIAVAPLGSASVCATGRKGPLCGKCEDGLSVVVGFGTTCKKCSSYERYWVIVVIEIIAGPLLVLLLFVLKLTLTAGTINGIIFYANIIYTASLTSLLHPDTHHMYKLSQYDPIIAANFISLLNLRSGIPICLFNNMDQLDKVSMGIVFPYYLLLIVIIIIIISHYSVWLSNKTSHSSLQVLVTIVHISFSTLIGTCAEVFSSARIYTNEGMYRVWKYDGSIEFLKHPRHILFTIGLSLAVLPLVIAYLLFLIFSKYLLKCSWKHNLKVRHIYEAIHAPYKEGRECAFVARLLLLTITCFLSMIEGHRIKFEVTAILIVLITIGHVIFPPYKSRALNILDAWVLLQLCFVYIEVLINRFHVKQGMTNSINFVLVTFIGVIVYHLLKVTKLLDKIKTIAARISVWITTCYRFRMPIPSVNSQDQIDFTTNDSAAPLCSRSARTIIVPLMLSV